MDISIIICTYNRCESLKDTLDSFLTQGCDGCDFEIIVVDNNSTDKTKEVVKNYISIFANKLRYVFEEKQGQSHARNAGIKASRGNIIAFTDDDVIVPQNWIINITQKFKHDRALMALVGGYISIADKDVIPKMNRDLSECIIGKIPNGGGFNMAFRKELFAAIGFFDGYLGPGSRGYCADDTDFIYRIKKYNKKLVYAPEIIIFHKIRSNQDVELKLLHRDARGLGFFMIKHLMRGKDFKVCMGIVGYLYYQLKMLFLSLRDKKILERKHAIWKLYGFAWGIVSGMLFWPFQKRVLV